MYGCRLKTNHFNYKPLLKISKNVVLVNQQRQIMIITKILREALKIRYLLLGGAVGGSVTLQKKYEQWKEGLPDTSWINRVMPTEKQWSDFRTSLMSVKDSVADSLEFDRHLKKLNTEKFKEYQKWFNERLNNAIKAADSSEINENENSDVSNREVEVIRAFVNQIYSDLKDEIIKSTTAFAESKTSEAVNSQQRMDSMQEEVMKIQLKYQRELERLEHENKELRKQILLRGKIKDSNRKIKKSLIDMYSDVLDELNGYDSTYSITDHLPRVVVVGDQSSGKTSVLEMIAQARIFPRGGGEMMTRSPVKVTLSEGPYHIAQFKDSVREFDLTKESDLAELRNEVELRMKNSVKDGKTVSHDVIAMTVKGPGLPRMILVDLPGIISTVTVDMADNTREAIRQMSEQYMSNPNAIILCIQDGSVDAERSNVTDIVSQMDPTGKRTIFVLTKVDLAEKNMTNPGRLKKILSGKLFPMKAMGYFAVVTGCGRQDDPIQTIKKYEEEFFTNSKLFKGEIGLSSQVTTGNLSLAVADCFWKMVRATVEQQADAFKATRYNLETEWKNRFPSLLDLDRDELFEKARIEILDEVVKLSQVSATAWERLLINGLWEKLSNYVFDNIYLPAAQSRSAGSFNTIVDIKLKDWTEHQLPTKSVEIGWDCLQQGFNNFITESKLKANQDGIYDNLIQAVIQDAISKFTWEEKAVDMLRIIQFNVLDDRNVTDKKNWDEAAYFLECALKDKIKINEQLLRSLVGPGFQERWLHWTYRSSEQEKLNVIKSELDKILYHDQKHDATLSQSEIAVVKANLRNRGIEIENENIREVWHPLYKKFFLDQCLLKAYDCKKCYYLYQTGFDRMGCNDIVMFWRVQRMIKVTANALRQQIMNREARRLGKEIKDTLDDYGQDSKMKEKLLTSKRVTLAEELKRVRQIQDKLEDFIQALNTEK